MNFDHRDPGTAEADWLESQRWHSLPNLTIREVMRVVVVAAHPDDETLGAAGTIAALSDLGASVTIVLATRGERAISPESSRDRLAEFEVAVGRIAPRSRVIDLALPDSALSAHHAELQEALCDAAVGAQLIIAPWRGDGHADHHAAGHAASVAAAETGASLIEYPIWLWHWGTPSDRDVPWDHLVRFSLDPEHRRRKRMALEAYESQTTGFQTEAPMLHRRMLAHFERPWETFVSTDR